MSEYQYYEFKDIDKPLNEKEIRAPRKFSSRAQITPISFQMSRTGVIFKGDPFTLMRNMELDG